MIIEKKDNQVIIKAPDKDVVSSEEKPYRVVFIMDCHALNSEDAALYVEGCMEDMDFRPVLNIIDSDGNVAEIDLEEE